MEPGLAASALFCRSGKDFPVKLFHHIAHRVTINIDLCLDRGCVIQQNGILVDRRFLRWQAFIEGKTDFRNLEVAGKGDP